MSSIRCTVNFIIGFTLNIYDSCIFHIDKRIRIFECNITFNGNIHRLCRIGYIDLDFTSINPRRDLVITALGDFHARSGDRRDRSRVFLRIYAIFRRTPQSKCIDRKDRCHHACRKHCTDEPHLLFFHPQNLCFLLNF